MQTNAGYADLDTEFVVDNLESLEKIIQEISDKFIGAIRKYNFIVMKNQYIIRSLPDMKL